MGRGAACFDNQQTFRGQLKGAFGFLNNPQFEPWEVGPALCDRLTGGRHEVRIAVDWTPGGDFMILEARLGVEGRGLPFCSLSVPPGEMKGRQPPLELSLDYALAARRRPGPTVYTLLDRGFAALDDVAPSAR